MANRRTQGPLAVAVMVIALSSAALLTACGTGSLTSSSNRGKGTPLVMWCSVQPGDSQRVLLTAMGTPVEQRSPRGGHPLYLNVTPRSLLSLRIAFVPMHRSEGYAVWKSGGYLLEDTYSAAGTVARMAALPIEASAMRKLGCAPGRGAPFGLVTVPNVVGHSMAMAETEIHFSNLTPSQQQMSNASLRTTIVRLQSPFPGTRVVAGSTVRILALLPNELSFVYGGLTLQLASGIANPGVSRQEAIATYRQHSPGPQGTPTAVLLGYMTSHAGAGPVMHNRLVWVVEYTHAPIQLYGGPDASGRRTSPMPPATGTWIGVTDARTGQYLTTQNFGSP